MSPIKRRQFLQFAGSALAAVGLSQFELRQRSLQYGKILAQSTPRKLALLVGINQYPNNSRFSNLKGCVNDVELQRQLLVHRFGFNEADILTLTESQASRQGILSAFETHLIQQAQPGDVVVFHYSGHGSRLQDPDPLDPDNLNSTFVPADLHPQADQGIGNDIMGKTLFLLMYALRQKTENLTVVLDSCYAGGGTRGNTLIRALDQRSSASPEELAYQQQWLSRLNLTPEQLRQERQKGVAAGVVLAAAQRNQTAADYKFPGGFAAGAFTYLLTQSLWQQTPEVERLVAAVSSRLRSLPVAQIPLYEVKPGSPNTPIYGISRPLPPAEAVITSVQGNKATVWLGGINPDSLEAMGTGAVFTPSQSSRQSSVEVELLSRQGLEAQAQIQGNAQPGELLQEFARAIPSDWKLLIGLDPSLGADANLAQQKLHQFNRIEAVLFQSETNPYGGQSISYILARMTPELLQKMQSSQTPKLPDQESLGLFTPALEILPQSFGDAKETVDNAIIRLEAKLKSLLAAKVIKMTLNAESSRLKLTAILGLEGNQKIVAEAFTVRGNCQEPSGNCSPDRKRGGGTQQLKVGDALQFKVTNGESFPLYLGILLVDPLDGITVFFPNEFQDLSNSEADQSSRLEPGQTRLIPDPQTDDFLFEIRKTGRGEMLIVASKTPLTNALLRLRRLALEQGVSRGVVNTGGNEAVEVVNDLLNDLSGSRSESAVAGVRQRVRTEQIAALSIGFDVVD